MERFLTFTVNKNSGFHTVGQVLRSQGGLTKNQISRAKIPPTGNSQKRGPLPGHRICLSGRYDYCMSGRIRFKLRASGLPSRGCSAASGNSV